MSRSSASLAPQDEVTLIARAQGSHPAARLALEELVRRYQPLIRTATSRAPAELRDDAYQSACIAFITSVRRFKRDRGPSLSSFAGPAVRGAVIDAIAFGTNNNRSIDRDPDTEPTELYILDESHNIASRFIDRLDGVERQVAKALVVEGMSQADIARRRGVSRAAVSKVVRRLREEVTLMIS